MARYEHIKIFQVAYILTVEIHKVASKFGKKHRYTLGEKIKNLCSDMLDMIVVANAATEKQESLKMIDAQLEKIRIQLRIVYDLRIISAGLLGILNKRIEEVGRQLGGWQKWAEEEACPSAPARVSVD
jgi:hypothetical protein